VAEPSGPTLGGVEEPAREPAAADRDLAALEDAERELADLEDELRRLEGSDEPADG
jgi:hypothetical protein